MPPKSKPAKPAKQSIPTASAPRKDFKLGPVVPPSAADQARMMAEFIQMDTDRADRLAQQAQEARHTSGATGTGQTLRERAAAVLATTGDLWVPADELAIRLDTDQSTMVDNLGKLFRRPNCPFEKQTQGRMPEYRLLPGYTPVLESPASAASMGATRPVPPRPGQQVRPGAAWAETLQSIATEAKEQLIDGSCPPDLRAAAAALLEAAALARI